MPKREENAQRPTHIVTCQFLYWNLAIGISLELGAFALKSDRMLGFGAFLQPAPTAKGAHKIRLRQGYGAAGRLE
jgi:hypothetical protein